MRCWNDSDGGVDLMQTLGTTNDLAILAFVDEGSFPEEDVAGIFDGEDIRLLFFLHDKPNGAGIHPVVALVIELGIAGYLVNLPLFLPMYEPK